jgi:hypothetical protein
MTRPIARCSSTLVYEEAVYEYSVCVQCMSTVYEYSV